MLIVKELQNKSYEDRINEAITKIPLISPEWTNFNPSDPGMTVLENLTLFNALQGDSITKLSYRARSALFKMVGFTPRKGKCARLLLSSDNLKEPVLLKPMQKFKIGDLCYETSKQLEVGGSHVIGIYSYYEDKYHDISYCCDREVMLAAKLFGDDPKVGDSVYIMVDNIPDNIKETIFYINMDEKNNRNTVENRTESIFAQVKWEYYTEKGFEDLKARDYTGAFQFSGEVKFSFGNDKPAIYKNGPEEAYCIRATLTKAEYDVRPKLIAVEGFLFEVWQKDTKSICITTNKTDNIEITSTIDEEPYIAVFAKEEKGSAYRRYELSRGGGVGRFCIFEETGSRSFRITFDKERFGYEPIKVKDCVRVIIYNEEMMRSYNVGKVIGYDNQEIEIPAKHIVRDSFCLIARRVDENGENIYDFVRPEKKGEDDLYYHLLENDGKIIIEDAGDYIGAELFIGMIAVTDGDKGNILSGNELVCEAYPDIKFYNPGRGTGGVFREKLEDVRKRFAKDMNTPYTAVTAADYEQIVKTTPGLCIKKAHAKINAADNLVRISVMPGTDDEWPTLSDIYIKEISDRLEERRLITTRFQIIQPVYAAVSVKGTIYVKRHYSGCREKIMEKLSREINYIESSKNFGDVLRFEDVFHGIETLDCVQFVYELSLSPENPKIATLQDSDIYPKENCLCYLGDVQLEIVTYEE
ncbi:MAG: baseplate J/gp47 family protein [Butyrivibrio sp.]|nr:baseplate J/gp47 family protein [Butyrivibrio sp.]